jgi:hypothetical protein
MLKSRVRKRVKQAEQVGYSVSTVSKAFSLDTPAPRLSMMLIIGVLCSHGEIRSLTRDCGIYEWKEINWSVRSTSCPPHPLNVKWTRVAQLPMVPSVSPVETEPS